MEGFHEFVSKIQMRYLLRNIQEVGKIIDPVAEQIIAGYRDEALKDLQELLASEKWERLTDIIIKNGHLCDKACKLFFSALDDLFDLS